MTQTWIPYGRHSIDQADIDAVVGVLRGNWLTTGPAVERFEEALSNLVGTPSVALSSGTAALHAGYAALGVEPGDEVITSPLTFIATAAAAAGLGAAIRLADISDETLTIDPAGVAEQITARTKVVAAVDYAGHPADLAALLEITRGANIALLEDAAHSLGATFRNNPVGSIADVTTFSFHPVKLITTGEGGAIASPHPAIITKAREFRSHGLIRDRQRFHLRDEGPWHQEVQEFGLNYRMPDILAALGVSQLDKLESFQSRRTQIAGFYREAFRDLPGVTLPPEKSDITHGWHLFVIRVPADQREPLYRALHADGIGTQVHYLPLHLHPVFAGLGYSPGAFPLAERAYREMLSLPLHPTMTDSDCERVVERVLFHFDDART